MAPAHTPLSVPDMVNRGACTDDGPVIDTRGLTKRYGQTVALDGLDLSIRRGEVYGFLGPNGSGKSTTIRLLLGLHRPSSGSASLFGTDVQADHGAAHARLAYVPGEPGLWPTLNATETFTLLAALRGGTDERYRAELIDRFELDVRKRIRSLSKGNRQKVALIAALSTRAELLLLDEPTSGLDPLMEIAFRDSISEARARGQTVFLSSHILSEVEALCDRLGILRDGRLVDEGTLSELRRLRTRTVEVRFSADVAPLAPLPGVSVTAAAPRSLTCEVTGEIGPLIDELAGLPVADLSCPEPSLEQIFVHHYRRGQ